MASSIVKSAAQQLGNLLVAEATALYEVKEKIENLQMELKWMECLLRDADTQQHREEVVCLWVSQIRDLTYEAEDTIERYLHGVSCHRQDGILNTLKWFSSILFNLDAWTLHYLGLEIDDFTARMSELTSRLQKYGIQIIRPTRGLEYNALIREERRTYSHTEEDVVGLVKDIQKVVDQLVLRKDVSVVGISGTGGLGKTTLARKVNKHKDIKHHFNDKCVWVYLSKEFGEVNIFQDLLYGLDKDEVTRRKIKGMSMEEVLTKIHEILLTQKCLVVLDDIWTDRSWERLKPAFESILTSNSASKILLATRNQGLLTRVDPSRYLHLLQPLSLDDSWELLQRKAFIGHGNTDDDQGKRDHEKEKLGKEIVKHCDGLPIAIVAIGGILRSKKTVSEWEDVQTNISFYLMSGVRQQGTSSQLFEILELSYNELPYYLKPCFLYLGIFPEDYLISTHRLYHMWEAEGFLAIEGEVRKEGGTTYDIGERYLNELIQRSMVQVKKCWASGRIKTCRVHDVVRDMCLRKCVEVSFLSHIEWAAPGMVSVVPPFSTEIKKWRRCALHGEDYDGKELELGEEALEGEDYDGKELEFGEKGKGLRSLVVFTEACLLAGKSWKSIPLLRVLDLEGAYLDSLDGWNPLTHLRYLSVRETNVQELPSCLFDLLYLENLDLRTGYEGVLTLTNKLYKMKRLRHLYLPENFNVEGGERLAFPNVGQMETIKNFDPERCETKELMRMTNLRVFSIRKGYIFEDEEELKGVLKAPVMIKAGQLINSLSIGVREDVLFINENCTTLRSVAGHVSFKVLRIKGPWRSNKDIEYCDDKEKGNTSTTIFPNNLKRVDLEECEISGDILLGLENLPCLEILNLQKSVIGGGGNIMSISPGSFTQLKQLCINHPNDGSLLEWEVGEEALPNLQLLEFTGCGKFNQLPNSLTRLELLDCRITTEEQILALEKLPDLKFLRLHGHFLYELSFSPGSFPQLAELYLEWVTESGEWEVGEGALPILQFLKLVRSKKVNTLLPGSLTRVELIQCDNLIGEGDVSLFSCLEKLPHLQLLRLNDVEGVTGCKKMTFSPDSFPQLIQFDFSGLCDLEELEFGEDSLPHLQHLNVHGWDNRLRNTNKLPDSLTHVVLEGGELMEGCDSLLSSLEKLSNLKLLRLDSSRISLQGNKISFSPGSFPQLTQLHIIEISALEELEVGEGALSNLEFLYLFQCTRLKKLPHGLPDSIHITCINPCIKGIRKYNTCPHFQKRWVFTA